MGGHISVGVRRANGTFRTVLGPVGVLKEFILDDRFMLAGNLESIDEYIAEWTEQYADGSVPGPYGFVLIDAIDKVVVNWSGYDRLSYLSTSPLEFGFTSKPDHLRIRDRRPAPRILPATARDRPKTRGRGRAVQLQDLRPFSAPVRSG